MGRLTTHVLDTAAGRPASGLRLELWALQPEPRFLKAATTNADGRVEAPLLANDEFADGVYELRFFVGEYLRFTVRRCLIQPFSTSYRSASASPMPASTIMCLCCFRPMAIRPIAGAEA